MGGYQRYERKIAGEKKRKIKKTKKKPRMSEIGNDRKHSETEQGLLQAEC